MTEDACRTLALGDLFHALASELGEVVALMQGLERALLPPPGWLQGPSPADLQRIDLAIQVLDDLGRFAARLGEGGLQNARIEVGPARAELRLERLRARFGPGLQARALGGPPAGDAVTLF